MIGLVVYFVAIYLTIGAILALPLMLAALKRIDPATQNATLGFRVLIIPSLAIMWPIVLVRVFKS